MQIRLYFRVYGETTPKILYMVYGVKCVKNRLRFLGTASEHIKYQKLRYEFRDFVSFFH